MKRMLSILFALILTVSVLAPAAVAEDRSSGSDGYYYVYTENGKGLNVREEPNGRVVGSLKYGTKVYVYVISDNWALIDYTYDKPGYGTGKYAAFLNTRFLRKNKPDPWTPSEPTVVDTSLADINEEFRSARRVEPYSVFVRPSRVSGWVNLRWAPSLEAEIMATYKANDELLVIRELTHWLQVEDQDTGDVGFISRQYVTE